MKTPKLEEIKEHFKNAKEVKDRYDTSIINIETIRYDVGDKNIILCHSNSEEGLTELFYNGKYAEIVSYKDTKPNHYPQGYDVIDFVKDKCVNTVMNKFKIRSEQGFEKYGNYLDREDYTLSDWLEEAQQEAMDFVLYIEAIKNKLKQLR